jgi:hypothetical protein
MNQKSKHCKVGYKVVEAYSEQTLQQKIEVDGVVYVLKYTPRPCKTISEVYAVYHNGVRYATFAKFLKTIKQFQE